MPVQTSTEARPPENWEKLKREHRLFEQLLTLARMDDLDTLLQSALLFAVDRVGAEEGFLALYEDGATSASVPRWCAVVGCTEDRARWPQVIQTAFSRGVTADALNLWRLLDVPSTMSNPEYSAHMQSFVVKKIRNVLAVPVGREARGVLVLQNRRVEQPPTSAADFGSDERDFAQAFASMLGPFVDRAVLRERLGNAAALGIVGHSRVMREVRENVRALSERCDVPALIEGPQGSGRKHIARALHEHSSRRARPLVLKRCSAWSPAEASEMLFGAEGATPRTALVASVDGGTLVLEDIEALPADAQAALVQFLDTGSYRPRHASADRQASVRVLATSSIDLALPVKIGTFRRDLYTRLNKGRIRLPPLSQRREDIAELLEHLGRAAAARRNLAWPGLTDHVLAEASLRPWTGNVTELSIAIEHALIGTGGTRPIDDEALFGPLAEVEPVPDITAWFRTDIPLMTWANAKNALHRAYLLHALRMHQGNKARTAKALRMGKAQLFANIKKFGLKGP